MAADTTDRNRWIAGIQYYVKDNERKSTVYYPGSPNTHTMPTPPITVTPEMETHLTAILQNHVRMVRKSATARERSPTVAGTPPSDQTLDGIATAIHDSSQEDDNDTHEARRRRIMSIDEGSNIIGLYADDKDSREASFSKKSSIQDLSDKNNYISSAHLSLSTSGTANDVCESPMESVQSHSVGDKPTLEQQHHSSLLTVSLTQSASFSTSQHSRPLSTSRIVSRSTSKNSSSAAALTAATTTTATATAAPPSTSPTSSSFERKQAFRNVSVSRVPTEDPLNGANVRRVNTMGSVSNSNGVNRPQPNDRSG